MFFSTAILLAVIVASPIWAHQNTAECGIGFDWVSGTYSFFCDRWTFQRFFPACGVYRIETPLVRIHASLVPSWMPHVAVLVSPPLPRDCYFVDESCHLTSLVEYTYPPLTDATQYYLPPMANHPGDMMCDCNTVMYRYEALSLKNDPEMI